MRGGSFGLSRFQLAHIACHGRNQVSANEPRAKRIGLLSVGRMSLRGIQRFAELRFVPSAWRHVAIELINELCCEKHHPDSPGPAVQSQDDCIDVLLGAGVHRSDSRLVFRLTRSLWQSSRSSTAPGSERWLSSAVLSVRPAKSDPQVVLRLLI